MVLIAGAETDRARLVEQIGPEQHRAVLGIWHVDRAGVALGEELPDLPDVPIVIGERPAAELIAENTATIDESNLNN